MLLCSIKYQFFPCVFVSVMSSQWVSNPTHNTKSYHYKPDYLSLLLLFFLSRRPPLNPSVVYFLPFFHVDERRNLQTDLLLKDGLTCFLLCENLLLSLSILSLCACLTDKAYWTITGVTLPPLLLLSADNSPTDSELCAFFGRHTTESWKEPARVPSLPVRS